MKESISYTFLLNIIIVFVLVCFSIIMGIFSYYRAFRANTIISQEIEKYEGYNCASKTEIARKLGNISYNTPFKVTCNNKATPCVVDEDANYAVISYNLEDISGEIHYAGKDEMSSPVGYDYNSMTYKETMETTQNYQYGIYTYMYIDLPVLSSMIRIPFFAKTDIMYEFRDLKYRREGKVVYDTRMLPEQDLSLVWYQGMYARLVQSDYANQQTDKESQFLNIDSKGYDARQRAKLDVNDDGKIDAADASNMSNLSSLSGIVEDCKTIKKFENY